jgi:cytidine deaminase
VKEPDALKLLRAAAATAKKAHAPYSKFRVGSALLASDGRIFTGCNVENASYGLTICAERNAIFAAVAAGRKKFKAVAIVASGKQMPYPCGACRQVLAEFCGPDTKVYIAPIRDLKHYESTTLGTLLPKTFSL